MKWIEIGTENCGKCGASYDVKKMKLSFKDRDTVECRCGNELRKWKETACYQYTLKSSST